MNEVKEIRVERKHPAARRTREATGEYFERPEGWTELTPKQFAESGFFEAIPEFMEKRRLPDKDEAADNRYGSLVAQLFHYEDNSGVAIVTRYDGCFLGDEPRMRYYLFGCPHDYRELSRKEVAERDDLYDGGSTWHQHECTLCGYVWGADTSD